MKKTRFFAQLLIMLFLLVFTAGLGEAKLSSIPVVAYSGGSVVMNLESNPTTGYRWQIDGKIDGKILKLVSSKYEPAKTRLVGAGGQEIWTFKALKNGKTKVSFKYVRPWEKNVAPIKKRVFELTIQECGQK